MATKTGLLTEKVLREILSSYVKAAYEPSEDTYDFLSKTSKDEWSRMRIQNFYNDILKRFQEDGITDNDPPLPLDIA
jgi:hypothetical protein